MILVVGATGELGSRIATRLRERGERVRALVRPRTDATTVEQLGVEVARGDLSDPDSLRGAADGVHMVITTATAISRALAGDRTATIRAIDLQGNANLVEAAERAGVQRFVFVSFAQSAVTLSSPLGAAKHATEERLARSSMRALIVRPEMFQEVWLTETVGLDWAAGKVQIFGKGETRNAYIAIDDVAEATVRVALEENPPAELEIGGPEALTRVDVVRRFEAVSGRVIKRRHIPRLMLRGGAVALRRVKPVQATLMALALHADLAPRPLSAEPLRELGIDPRPAGAYIEELARRGA